MIHATRSVAYGCSRQGLTRFATSLWMGPLPAPRRGGEGRCPTSYWTPTCSVLARTLVDHHLVDDDRLLGPRPCPVLGVGDDRLLSYCTHNIQPVDDLGEERIA